MQELEKETYNFAVQTIGFVRSLEKAGSNHDLAKLKTSAAKVSTIFIEAMEANENKEFADNLRECLKHAKHAHEELNKISVSDTESPSKELDRLKSSLNRIEKQLEEISTKLIY